MGKLKMGPNSQQSPFIVIINNNYSIFTLAITYNYLTGLQ